MKKIINLKMLNGIFFGLIAISGFITWAFPLDNLFIRLFIVGLVLILWIISLMVSLWKNNVFLNTENTNLGNQINNLKSDNNDLSDKNKILESANKDLIDSNETLKNNREGLKQQIEKDKNELQVYESQVTDYKNAIETLSRESTSIIGLMLTNSPTKELLYKQLETIQSSAVGNEIYNIDYSIKTLYPIVQTKEKLLEQEQDTYGKEIKNH